MGKMYFHLDAAQKFQNSQSQPHTHPESKKEKRRPGRPAAKSVSKEESPRRKLMGSRRKTNPSHTAPKRKEPSDRGKMTGTIRRTAPVIMNAFWAAREKLMGRAGASHQPKDSTRSAVRKIPGQMVAKAQP